MASLDDIDRMHQTNRPTPAIQVYTERLAAMIAKEGQPERATRLLAAFRAAFGTPQVWEIRQEIEDLAVEMSFPRAERKE